MHVRHCRPTPEQKLIRRAKASLCEDRAPIEIIDFGAACGEGPPVIRHSTVSRVVRSASKPSRQAERLAWWVVKRKAQNVLELGTCLGTTSAVLAAVPHRPKVVSLEGDPGLAARARAFISQLNASIASNAATGASSEPLSVEVVEGEISSVLPEVVKRHRWDLVFIDGHHTAAALSGQLAAIIPQLASEACVIIDDIYWSRDMHAGWTLHSGSEYFSEVLDEFHHGVLLRGDIFAPETSAK